MYEVLEIVNTTSSLLGAPEEQAEAGAERVAFLC